MIYGKCQKLAFEENVLKTLSDLLRVSSRSIVSFFDEHPVHKKQKIVFYENNLAFVPKIKKESTLFGESEITAWLDIYRKSEWTDGQTSVKPKIRFEFDCKIMSVRHKVGNSFFYQSVPCFDKILWEQSYVYFPDFKHTKIPLDWKMEVTPDDLFLISEDLYSLYEINLKN